MSLIRIVLCNARRKWRQGDGCIRDEFVKYDHEKALLEGQEKDQRAKKEIFQEWQNKKREWVKGEK